MAQNFSFSKFGCRDSAALHETSNFAYLQNGINYVTKMAQKQTVQQEQQNKNYRTEQFLGFKGVGRSSSLA
ncbi:hypothetical protein QUA76_09260 [Microcoleus sp. F8-A4]